MTLNKKVLVYLSIAYVYIPIGLFLFGWTKIWVALICSTLLLYGIIKMSKSYTTDIAETIKINLAVVVITIIFFMLIGYFAGWGRWCNQAYDWLKHNAILKDLTLKSWPVYYKNGNEKSMLTYYIAQYLIPAAFGKVLNSFRSAEIVNYIYAEIGLILVWLNLVRIIKIKDASKQILSAFILIFFSCPLWLAQIIGSIFFNIGNFNPSHFFVAQDGIILQYSSNFTLLKWVFPQAIVIWLVLLLFIENKEKIQHYITLILPCLLFATLSFVGVLLLALGCAVFDLIHTRKINIWFRKVFSLENILSFLSLGTAISLYFYGNILGKKPDNISLHLIPYDGHWEIYIIFVVVMVLFYSLCVWNDAKKNELFYFSVLTLILLPLFSMGLWNDLVMRCSIPSLFILMYLIIRFLNSHMNKRLLKKSSSTKIDKVCLIIICSLLLIGSYYPLAELKTAIETSYTTSVGENNFGTMENFANRDLNDVAVDVKYNYYSYDIQNNLFYKFIAKRKNI